MYRGFSPFCPILGLVIWFLLGTSCSDSCSLDPSLYVNNLKDINIAIFLDVHQAGPSGCGQINPSAVQELEAVSFVFDKINNAGYIPGTQLGFVAYDTCSSRHLAAESLRHLTSKVDNHYASEACSNTSGFIFGIAGPSTSSESLAMSKILMAETSVDRLIQISHSATATTVTASGDFSNAFSVIPPDNIQVQVIVDMMKQLSWNYVALIYTDDTYGENGAAEILRMANASGICMAFLEKLSSIKNEQQVQSALHRVLQYGGNTRPATTGVVFFGTADIAYEVLKQAKTYERGKLQFIFSDSVQFRSDVFADHWTAASGSLVVEPTFTQVSTLETHLKNIYNNKTFLLERSSSNPWLKELYKNQTNCSPATEFNDCPAVSDVDVLATHSLYTYYMLEVAFVYANIIKAVYQETCKMWPCPKLEALSRDVIRSKLSTMSLSFRADFGSIVPPEMRDGIIVFHINGTRVQVNQDQSLYEIKNLQINTCPGGSNYCLVKVGSYNGRDLSLDVGNIKSYKSDKSEIPTLVPAECPVGAVCEACLRDDASKHFVYVPGDLIILASAPIFHPGSAPFTCGNIRLEKGVQIAEAILFAVKKINEKQGLFGDVFPGRTIGTVIMNTCYSETVALKKTLSLFFDDDPYLIPKVTNLQPKVIGFMGSLRSGVSEEIASILTRKKLAQIAYGSTSVTLSDRQAYPYFSRTCASDEQQGEIMVLLLKAMGWKYISVVYSDDSYGTNGFEVVHKMAREKGVCIAQNVQIDQNPQYYSILDKLRQTPAARVVILFLRSSLAKQLLEAFSQKNDYQSGEFIFILTESVGNRASVIEGASAAIGSFSLLQEIPENKEFDQYLSGRAASKDLPEKVWLDKYWEPFLGCYRSNSFNKSSGRVCGPDDSLTGGAYFQDPWTPFAINAMYSLVLGADNAARGLCGSSRELCQRYRENPSKVRDGILNTELDIFGTGLRISAFDSNGDGTVSFRIFNIQYDNSAKPSYVKVGLWNKQEELVLEKNKLGYPNGMGAPISECPNPLECERCSMVCSMKETCTGGPTGPEDNFVAFPVVASILGAALVVVVIILVIICCRQRKRSETDKELRVPESHAPPVPEAEYLHAMEMYCTVRESFTPRPARRLGEQGTSAGHDNHVMEQSSLDDEEPPPYCQGRQSAQTSAQSHT